jgi:hypothetical protein
VLLHDAEMRKGRAAGPSKMRYVVGAVGQILGQRCAAASTKTARPRDADLEAAMGLRDDDKYLAKYLKIAKREIEHGNKSVLLKAMHQCLIMKRPLPEWLRLAFLQAYQSAYPYEVKSWDEIFGPPHPKGAHLKTRKQHFELRFPIWSRVQELAKSGENIDKGLFEKVGKEFKVSGTTASAIYYDQRTRIFDILNSADKRSSEKN